MKVVVDRTKWIRGVGQHRSALLVPPKERWSERRRGVGFTARYQAEDVGKMCCMGFACLALGQSEADIEGLKVVADEVKFPQLPETHAGKIAALHDLYFTNDHPEEEEFTESDRERLITERGKALGLDFEFVN